MNNGNTKSDLEKIIAKSNEFTEAISVAKDKYIKSFMTEAVFI